MDADQQAAYQDRLKGLTNQELLQELVEIARQDDIAYDATTEILRRIHTSIFTLEARIKDLEDHRTPRK